MNRYKAYTQKEWNAEKFYIEDENQVDLVIYAEDEKEAKEKFVENIYETSLYSEKETEDYIKENPVYVLKVDDKIQYITQIIGKTDTQGWYFKTPQEAINYAKEITPCDKYHKIEVWEIENINEEEEDFIRQIY